MGFLDGRELALMHVNWLPGLADDLYYEFLAFRKKYPTLGTLGGHLIFLNLGEQIRTSETGDELGTFTSYMTAMSFSYSALISPSQSFGINSKISYQHLVEIGAGSEKGSGTSIDFGFDLGYMHKGLKAANQLRMMEDALVIYRISRAPERRIFYIDVGNLPKAKAEQYLADTMNKYRNKLVYNADTGEIKDDRRHMSMLEDFWLPRREGGRGTEITTLPGGQNLAEIEDIEYFKKKLYRSLNVPSSRLEADNGFNMGRASEISRDELKFNKFTKRLQTKFARCFTDILRTQLVLKNLVSGEEFDAIKDFIYYDFATDNHFTELKEGEIMRERLDILSQAESYVGKYFSDAYVQKHILHMSEDDIVRIKGEIDSEGHSEEDDF